MDNIDIDKFIPKFLSKEEIEDLSEDLSMKQILLNIDEQALDQMLNDNKISENDYFKMKNNLNEQQKNYFLNKLSWNEIKNYFENKKYDRYFFVEEKIEKLLKKDENK